MLSSASPVQRATARILGLVVSSRSPLRRVFRLCRGILSEFDSARLVVGMASSGLLNVRFDGKECIPTTTDLLALAAGEAERPAPGVKYERWWYEISDRGGRTWEELAAPVWSDYFRLSLVVSTHGGELPIELCAARREVVDRFMVVCGEAWSLPWIGDPPRYDLIGELGVGGWKVLRDLHRVRFEVDRGAYLAGQRFGRFRLDPRRDLGIEPWWGGEEGEGPTSDNETGL